MVAFLLVNVPNCHLSLVLASVVQGDAVNCSRTVCFLRTNWYCMLGSSHKGLQRAFDLFSNACDQAGTKISSKKIEVLCLSRRPRQCILQVCGNILQQIETSKYLEVVFTSDGSRN